MSIAGSLIRSMYPTVKNGGRRGRDLDRMVVGFNTIYVISAYHQ